MVDTNHAAFVYGHLAIYPARLLTMMKMNPAALVTPEAYTELFKAVAGAL